jgi:aerobic-type carbon monoxide dehydrogenase small subunit (CoxS/CutS family)
MPANVRVRFTVNGEAVERDVEPRLLLVDFLRHDLRLTGTHVGCEHGVCGACTVLVDGATARSCLTFVAQADGAAVTTVEGLEQDPGTRALEKAFHEHHALQCGYCTPGFLLAAREFLAQTPQPSERDVRVALSGNLCRCTGYVNIIDAVLAAAQAGEPA